jgi:hypothetical protein
MNSKMTIRTTRITKQTRKKKHRNKTVANTMTDNWKGKTQAA